MTNPPHPSRSELNAQKLATVRGLLERRTPLSEVKHIFAQEFSCSRRSAERFITQAYELMRLDSNKSPEAHLAEAYTFYLSIIRDTTNSTRDRMHAQERIDKLFGLEGMLKARAAEQSVQDNLQPTFSQAEIRLQLTEAISKVLTHATPSS